MTLFGGDFGWTGCLGLESRVAQAAPSPGVSPRHSSGDTALRTHGWDTALGTALGTQLLGHSSGDTWLVTP